VKFHELEKVYRGKRVFLTGHTGFKGAWMLQTLNLLGAEVMGYALEPYSSDDLFSLLQGEKMCNSCIADLRDKKKLESEIIAFQPDFIFHFAAQPLVRLSYEIPAETFEVNVIGTANLLDGVKALKKKCSVVLITTDKVYHNNEWEYPYRENDKLGGFDPYSASKACAELLIDSYRKSFFNLDNYAEHMKGIAVARAGNVIGGGDWSKDRIIPDIVRAFIARDTVIIRNPNAVRPWQHVLEPIAGYLKLGCELDQDPIKFSRAYNFGPYLEDSLSVHELFNLATYSWGSGECSIEDQFGERHEAGLLKLDISKAKKDLSWSPKLNAEQAVKMTLDWYSSFSLKKNDIPHFTIKQIIEYFNG